MTDARATTLRRRDLEDEREFLVASLEDAEREHEAGDLSDDDYAVLTRRDRTRLDEVTGLLTAHDEDEANEAKEVATNGASPRGAATGQRSRRPLVLVLAGTALVLIGAVVLVIRLTSDRLPGQTATGSVQLSQAQRINQELGQADALLSANDVTDAAKLYSQVLQLDPHDPPALAQLGWLTYEQGVVGSDTKSVTAGRDLVEEAIAADGSFGPAHLYDGVILLDTDHNAAGAVAQFEKFLAEHPSAQNLRNGASFIRQAFNQDHQPVPPGVPYG